MSNLTDYQSFEQWLFSSFDNNDLKEIETEIEVDNFVDTVINSQFLDTMPEFEKNISNINLLTPDNPPVDHTQDFIQSQDYIQNQNHTQSQGYLQSEDINNIVERSQNIQEQLGNQNLNEEEINNINSLLEEAKKVLEKADHILEKNKAANAEESVFKKPISKKRRTHTIKGKLENLLAEKKYEVDVHFNSRFNNRKSWKNDFFKIRTYITLDFKPTANSIHESETIKNMLLSKVESIITKDINQKLDLTNTNWTYLKRLMYGKLFYCDNLGNYFLKYPLIPIKEADFLLLLNVCFKNANYNFTGMIYIDFYQDVEIYCNAHRRHIVIKPYNIFNYGVICIDCEVEYNNLINKIKAKYHSEFSFDEYHFSPYMFNNFICNAHEKAFCQVPNYVLEFGHKFCTEPLKSIYEKRLTDVQV